MSSRKAELIKQVMNLLVITLGAALMAVSVNMFLEPHNVVSGGVTGIAMTISFIFKKLPVGTMVLLINIPLFLASWKLFGGKFLIGSVYGTVIYSVLIDFSASFLPAVNIDPLLAAIFGGVLMGTGLGLVFLRGATTGGSDIAARLLKLVFPYIQMGQLILLLDAVVITFAGVVTNSVSNTFYSAVAIYVDTVVLDKILYGVNFARMAYIISDEHEKIEHEITNKLGRGVTILNGRGSYSKKEKDVLLCVIKRQQIAMLKNLVKDIDPKAFVILCEANEVLGEGFGAYDKNSF